MAKCFLFCTLLMLASRGTLAFWLFSDYTVATPTVKFYPEPPEADRGSTFIYYDLRDIKSSQKHIESIRSYLKTYKESQHEENSVYCSFDSPPAPNKFCVYRTDQLGPCSADRDFGFREGRPCIFLTLSKVENWIPTTLNESDILDLSFPSQTDTFSTMPTQLRNYISQQEEKHIVWVSCNGDTGADIENIGPISYYPAQGFPSFYFPFTNVEGYQSPIVAVRFERPMNGIVISIECKLWAKNIKLERGKEIGIAKIHLLID